MHWDNANVSFLISFLVCAALSVIRSLQVAKKKKKLESICCRVFSFAFKYSDLGTMHQRK
ncbi:hypothetical protein Hanom_Chr06g00571641 [Helianthus anomalus]